jgi:hypothetical protein
LYSFDSSSKPRVLVKYVHGYVHSTKRDALMFPNKIIINKIVQKPSAELPRADMESDRNRRIADAGWALQAFHTFCSNSDSCPLANFTRSCGANLCSVSNYLAWMMEEEVRPKNDKQI